MPIDKYRSIQNRPTQEGLRLIQGDYCRSDNALRECPMDWEEYEKCARQGRKFHKLTSTEGFTVDFD